MAESPVYDPSTCETPQVEHFIDMLDPTRDADIGIDCFGKSRCIGNDTDKESDCGPPVGSVFVVAISCVAAIETWDIDGLSLDEPVVASENCSNWSQEDTQSSHETEQRGGAVDLRGRLVDERLEDGNRSQAYDLPWNHDPASDHSCQDYSTPIILISRVPDGSWSRRFTYLMFMYFGAKFVMSFAHDITFALRFVPI